MGCGRKKQSLSRAGGFDASSIWSLHIADIPWSPLTAACQGVDMTVLVGPCSEHRTFLVWLGVLGFRVKGLEIHEAPKVGGQHWGPSFGRN